MSRWGGAPVRRVSPSRQDRIFGANVSKDSTIPEGRLRQEIADRDAEITHLRSVVASQEIEIKRLNATISAPTVAGQARKIATEVAAEFGFTFFDLISQSRNMQLVRARKKAMWRIRNECSHMSLPMIGKLFGDRDHTTALHCINDYQKHVEAGTAW